MSIEYIRKTYGVPAAFGARVLYTYPKPPIEGVVVGARGPLLRIRLDGEEFDKSFHPTWELKFLSTNAP